MRLRLRGAIAEWRGDLRTLLAVRAAERRVLQPHDSTDGEPRQSVEFERAREQWLAGRRPEGLRQITIAGLTISVPPDEGSPKSLSARVLRGWLPLEDIARARRFVRDGVMLDIGANIGTTCIPRVVLSHFSRAYAAEPDAVNYAVLVGNVVDNGLVARIHPDRLAISDSNGTARLRITGRIGSHRLVPADRVVREPVEEVPCVTVDTWLDRRGVPDEDVTFVKVDTQGWDLRVLRGAERLLSRRQAVWQVEVSPSHMKSAGCTVEDLTAFVGTHFTRVADLGDATRPVDARDLANLLARALAHRRFANILLLNAGG